MRTPAPAVVLLRHRDVLLGAATGVVYAAEVLASDVDPGNRLLPFALLGGLGLAVRRRAPLAGFALATSAVWAMSFTAQELANASAALLVLLLVSLYSLGRYADGWRAPVGVGAVSLSVLTFVVGDPGTPAVGDVGFALAFLGTPWGAGVAVRLRRERESRLVALNEDLRAQQEERARRAVAEERARLARELHDVVSHAIAVTVLQARGARRVLGRDQAEVRRCLDAIERTNSQALGDMRRLLSLLRDTEDDRRHEPQPSLARVGELVDDVRRSGLPVELQVRGDSSGGVPPGVDLTGYRVVQEALTNVLKHAGGSATARVDVAYEPDELVVEVVDDGRRSGEAAPGFGLLGMRERVAVVGGEVEARPGPAGGFVVRARLPYEAR